MIFQALFGQDDPRLLFDVMLHVGTLAAILLVFRESIAETMRDALGLVGLAKKGEKADAWMPAAIVVGAEQYGLSNPWLQHADMEVMISMLGQADSLNVAQAATILLYEAVRQRMGN